MLSSDVEVRAIIARQRIEASTLAYGHVKEPEQKKALAQDIGRILQETLDELDGASGELTKAFGMHPLQAPEGEREAKMGRSAAEIRWALRSMPQVGELYEIAAQRLPRPPPRVVLPLAPLPAPPVSQSALVRDVTPCPGVSYLLGLEKQVIVLSKNCLEAFDVATGHQDHKITLRFTPGMVNRGGDRLVVGEAGGKRFSSFSLGDKRLRDVQTEGENYIDGLTEMDCYGDLAAVSHTMFVSVLRLDQTPQHQFNILAHTGRVKSLAVGKDFVASVGGSREMTVRLWRTDRAPQSSRWILKASAPAGVYDSPSRVHSMRSHESSLFIQTRNSIKELKIARQGETLVASVGWSYTEPLVPRPPRCLPGPNLSVSATHVAVGGDDRAWVWRRGSGAAPTRYDAANEGQVTPELSKNYVAMCLQKSNKIRIHKLPTSDAALGARADVRNDIEGVR